MKYLFSSLACLLGLCLTAVSAQAQQPGKSAPEIVRTTCYMCHSTHGNNPDLGFIPRLAAQSSAYIEDQLKAFRDGSRADPPATMYMWPIAQGLSDNQIKQVAVWFSSQPPAEPFPASSAAKEGREIFLHGILKEDVPACASCHGPKADGNGIFPRLAGQNTQYLLAQLRYFRSGVRNDKGADIMKPIAQHLTDDQMSAVADYLSTL
ncbi:MAG: cytochrome c4 [Gammaproteobacteria bacterium]|nr:cytochrome c4 [Gammaproteobacteria bacterium]MDE2346538.1 cytochrome c4 [Gammaproteobacteria bacterium]